MRRGALVILLFLSASPLTSHAQQSSSGGSPTDQQKLGRRLFEQRCAVCHTQVTSATKRYGPALYKELVDGNESAMRDFIRNGSPGKMPGFKYGMEPNEIDAIVEYLKTVPKPQQPSRSGEAGGMD